MGSAGHKWKKGESGNPKGRPTIILPEVRHAAEANKNAVKTMILQEMNVHFEGEEKVRRAVRECLERCIIDGDVLKLKMLLEIALGKLVDEPDEFPTSPEERVLVLAYRKRCELLKPNDGGDPQTSH